MWYTYIDRMKTGIMQVQRQDVSLFTKAVAILGQMLYKGQVSIHNYGNPSKTLQTSCYGL